MEKAVPDVSIKLARRVLEVVDKGLCNGVGHPIPGQMCVEAAVCYAMGKPHGDKPSCVNDEVRWAKITLNDMNWPSEEKRAEGLRRVAIAQLGSDQIEKGKFKEKLISNLLRDILIPYTISKHKDLTPKEKALLKKLPSVDRTQERLKTFCDIADNSTIKFPYYPLRSFIENTEKRVTSTDTVIDAMRGWIHSSENGNSQHESLVIIADCIEKTLKECKSPGVKWLHLCKK